MDQFMEGSQEGFGSRGIHGALWELGRSRSTGLLAARQGSVARSLFLADGRVQYGASNQANEWLGAFMVRAGLITDHAYTQTAKLVKDSHTKQGKILVERGYLTEEQLGNAIRSHVDWLVRIMIPWHEAELDFALWPPQADSIEVAGVEALQMVRSHIRSLRSPEQIYKLLGDPSAIPEPVVVEDFSAMFDSFTVTETEEAVLELLDGRCSFKQLAESSPAGELEALKALYALVVSGMARIKEDSPAPSSLPGSPDHDTAARWFSNDEAAALVEDFFHSAFGTAAPSTALDETSRLIVEHFGEPDEETLVSGGEAADPATSSADVDATILLPPGRHTVDDTLLLPIEEGARDPDETLVASYDQADEQPDDLEEDVLDEQSFDPWSVAVVAIERGQYARASQALWKAFEQEPLSTTAVRCADLLATIPSRLREAEQYLRKACELSPEHSDHHLKLGALLLKVDEPEDAMRALKMAIAWDPDNDTARKLYQEAYRRTQANRQKGFLSRLTGK